MMGGETMCNTSMLRILQYFLKQRLGFQVIRYYMSVLQVNEGIQEFPKTGYNSIKK